MCFKIENKVLKDYNYESQEPRVVIPNGVEEIGDKAFYVCSRVKEIIIPPSVKKIADCAFYKCGLVTIEIPDGVTYLGQEAFRDCEYLKSVRIGNGIDRIKAYTFKNCHNLERLELPSYLESVDYDALVECYILKSAWVGNWEYRLRDNRAPRSVKKVFDSIEASRLRFIDYAESGVMDEFEYTDYCIAGDGYSF